MENDKDQILLYGIVTNALQWIFLWWTGSPDNPKVEISGFHFSELDEEVKIKKITNYIASILQMQVSGLGSNKKIHL